MHRPFSLRYLLKKLIWRLCNKPKPIHVQFRESKAEALSIEKANKEENNVDPKLFIHQVPVESAVVLNSTMKTKPTDMTEKQDAEEEQENNENQEMIDIQEEKEKEKEKEVEEKGKGEKIEDKEVPEQPKDQNKVKSTNQVTVLNEGVDMEKVKKEFVSTLTRENRESLPDIQILKVFTTTPSPTTSIPSPTTSIPTPTTSIPTPTTSIPSPATSIPTPTTSIPSPATASSFPFFPTSLSTPSEPTVSTVTTVSTPQSYPSPWRKSNKIFKGVRIQLFKGTEKEAFSIFANRTSHTPSPFV